jgi:hypothetical protein
LFVVKDDGGTMVQSQCSQNIIWVADATDFCIWGAQCQKLVLFGEMAPTTRYSTLPTDEAEAEQAPQIFQQGPQPGRRGKLVAAVGILLTVAALAGGVISQFGILQMFSHIFCLR